MWYGLSEANGSWNTICTAFRYRRRAAPCRLMGAPSSRISPDVGVSSWAIMRATVDLPDPDSPTSAIVLPGSSVNDTSFTARSLERLKPLRSVKSLTRFRTSSWFMRLLPSG